MKKLILILIVVFVLFGSMTIVSAVENREPQPVFDVWFTGGDDATVDNPHSEDKKEIEPTPQPTLDLPLTIGFIFSTVIISLIVLFTISVRRYGNLVALEKSKINKNIQRKHH